MASTTNIGKWIAKEKNGTKPSLIIDGSFPANEKPNFQLLKTDSPSFNPTDFSVLLLFGELVSLDATATRFVHQDFVIETVNQYETVTVLDGNGRVIAVIPVEAP